MPIVNLPAGTLMSPALLKQIIEQCGTCNPCGSGSGSGAGAKLACCGGTSPTTISWSITGTTGGAACTSGTQADNTIECLLEPDDLSGFSCGVEAAATKVIGYTDTCIDGGTTTTITITLCCVEPTVADPDYPTRYRMAIYFNVNDGITSKSAQWCTEDFDFASCDPFHVEMVNWIPRFDEFGGAIADVVIT